VLEPCVPIGVGRSRAAGQCRSPVAGSSPRATSLLIELREVPGTRRPRWPSVAGTSARAAWTESALACTPLNPISNGPAVIDGPARNSPGAARVARVRGDDRLALAHAFSPASALRTDSLVRAFRAPLQIVSSARLLDPQTTHASHERDSCPDRCASTTGREAADEAQRRALRRRAVGVA
jgi:hypothetical protein